MFFKVLLFFFAGLCSSISSTNYLEYISYKYISSYKGFSENVWVSLNSVRSSTIIFCGSGWIWGFGVSSMIGGDGSMIGGSGGISGGGSPVVIFKRQVTYASKFQIGRLKKPIVLTGEHIYYITFF